MFAHSDPKRTTEPIQLSATPPVRLGDLTVLRPMLAPLSDRVRKKAERSLLQFFSRLREYDDLDAEHTARQREFDINARILMKLTDGSHRFEAAEMERRQGQLDLELLGLESQLEGLERALGWAKP